MDVSKDDFDKIRAQARAINSLYGGKIEINEWTTGDGEILKIVLTWKKSLPLAFRLSEQKIA